MGYPGLIIFPNAKPADKLVITSAEAQSAPELETTPAPREFPQRARGSIPGWVRFLAIVSALCLPLLCLLAAALRLGHRRAAPKVRMAWNSFLCTLLIASGLWTCFLFALTLALFPRSVNWSGSGGSTALNLEHLPVFPAAKPLDGEQIASEGNSTVFILTPDTGGNVTRESLNTAPVGAATLLMAAANGFLLATSRHVVEGSRFLTRGEKHERMRMFAHAGEATLVRVTGTNRDVDLALVWAPRKTVGRQFYQPIAGAAEIHAGEAVFVIGHPQRLFYTLSSGLVSRASDPHVLQFSAPVSPGNSGGPVYDSFGRLLGVVAAMVDRTFNPNAENLNFAVRSDRLLQDEGWNFQENGREALNQLRRSLAAHRFHD